ncbi:MAG: geranylgeranyl reductase family protein [Chloroflexota bacterium]
MISSHDVIVVGAGPAGSAAAHFLAKQGIDVLLLDKAQFPRDKTCGDGLTPRALGVLKDMGILERVEKIGNRLNGIELNVGNGYSMAAPIPKKDNLPNHIVIAPRLELDNIIRQAAIDSGAKFKGNTRVTAIEQDEHGAEVTASLGQTKVRFKAKIIIMAIGANIRLLTQMGILKKPPTMILAARGYYDGLQGLSDYVQAHFDGVPLPGYGWIFPISDSIANIGVGFWKPFLPWQKPPVSAAIAIKEFLASPVMLPIMNGAKAISPIKGYPLRIDFATAPTYHNRILLVGETAGLVSPRTGEGIDFALESGKLAAQFLEKAFVVGDFSASYLSGYDKLLRDHFQRLFVFLSFIRRLYVNPILIRRFVWAAERNPELKDVFVKIIMSEADAARVINLNTMRRIVFGR